MNAADTNVSQDTTAPADNSVLAANGITVPAAVKVPVKKPGRVARLLASWPACAVFAGFIGLWYLTSNVFLGTRGFLIPPPHVVLQEGFINGFTLGGLVEFFKKVLSDLLPFIELDYDIPNEVVFNNLKAFWLTVQISLIGLAIATVLGSLAAIVMAQAKWVERAFFPYAVLFQAVPILALVPLIGAIFGFGFWSRVFVCVLITFFPIVANMLFGLKSVERGQSDLFALHTSSRLTRLMRLQLPAAMPSFFTGLRIAAGLSVIGSIVGGIFFARGDSDLGSYISKYAAKAEYAESWSVIILSSLLGVAVFVLFGKLSDRVIGRWYDQEN